MLTNTLTINAGELFHAIKTVRHAVSKEAMRYYLQARPERIQADRQ